LKIDTIIAKTLEHYTWPNLAAVNQLKASKKTLSTYKKRIEQKDKEENKDLLKLMKSTKKWICILNGFMGKKTKDKES